MWHDMLGTKKSFADLKSRQRWIIKAPVCQVVVRRILVPVPICMLMLAEEVAETL